MAHVHFRGVELRTLPGLVMTPRPATEQLVAAAAERIGDRPARVADVGTGSGAIAVSLALADPRAEIWATDTSAAAVVLACANARRAGVAERIHVRSGDLLAGVPGDLDLIVANLPYLPSRDRLSLSGSGRRAPACGLRPRRRLRALPPPACGRAGEAERLGRGHPAAAPPGARRRARRFGGAERRTAAARTRPAASSACSRPRRRGLSRSNRGAPVRRLAPRLRVRCALRCRAS